MKLELCSGTKYLQLIVIKPTYSYIIFYMFSFLLAMYLMHATLLMNIGQETIETRSQVLTTL
jgi:hypothetical protein